MGDCDYPYLAPGGRDCSFGECVVVPNASNACVCNEGFEAIGDFHFEPLDCDQNLLSLRILWALLAVMTFAGALVSATYLTLLALSKRKARRSLIIYGLYVLANILFFALGLTKVIDPTRNLLGRDVGVTLLFSSGGSLWYVASSLVLQQLGTFYYLQAKAFGANLSFVYVYNMRLFFVLNFLSFFPPIISLFDTSNAIVYLILHFIFVGIMMLFMVQHFARRFLNKIIDDMGVALRNSSKVTAVSTESKATMQRLHKKLISLRGQTINNAYLNLLLVLAFASWPFLNRKVSYEIPVAWATSGITTVGICRMLGNTLVSSKSLSSKEGRFFGIRRFRKLLRTGSKSQDISKADDSKLETNNANSFNPVTNGEIDDDWI